MGDAALAADQWRGLRPGPSLLTPFFLGTAIGAIVTGRVRGAAIRPRSWVNPTSLLTGALFVATSAYLAAVYLATDSEAPVSAGCARTSPGGPWRPPS